MTAYSLRTWRRNGVACDELLFLPGTPHGDATHLGVDTATASSEGDVAAGLAPESPEIELPSRGRLSRAVSHTRSRSMSGDSSLSSVRALVNSWDEDEDIEGQDVDDDDDNERVPLRSEAANSRQQPVRQQSSADRSMHAIHSSNNSSQSESQQGVVQRFQELHPRLGGIGSFFFFRSSSTSTQSAAYAPSGPSVVGAALDLSMPILFNFHLYIEAYNYYDAHGGSEMPAKILPLIFLSILIVRTSIPPGRRGRFWGTMKCTFMAPFHASRFRDIFAGDVLTSMVRPMQDVVFALAYYVTVVYGTATSKYGLSDSGRILESSHLLHNVILPSCSLLPLWWKFLQTLRESYDTGQRWPYLGNAFKYLTAALVILYGMTHPEERQSAGWIICFTLALVYQLWWDTIMDWELFVIAPRNDDNVGEDNNWCTRISSVRPNSYILLALQRNIFQPIRDLVWFVLAHVPSWKQIQLRPRRLYKNDSFYWRIFAYNTIFRAAWMLCYIPSYHLDSRSFKSDTHNYLGVILPVVEILRRTLWGFLLLEVKTIHITNDDPLYTSVAGGRGDGSEADCSNDLSVDSSKHGSRQYYLPSWLGNQQQLQHDAATRGETCLTLDEEMRHKLVIAELSVWAFAFIVLGLWVTT
jgi:hypothetical protein